MAVPAFRIIGRRKPGKSNYDPDLNATLDQDGNVLKEDSTGQEPTPARTISQ